MTFRRGQKVEIYRKSDDESWQEYMNKYIGVHGRVTDPDAPRTIPMPSSKSAWTKREPIVFPRTACVL